MKRLKANLMYSSLSLLLLLGTVNLFTGQAKAQFSSPIHDVDNAARQPVQFGAEVIFTDTDFSASFSGTFTVPAGKRLVIESVDGQISVPTGEQFLAKIFTTASGVASGHALPFTSKVNFGSFDVYATAVSTRFYADPGTKVFYLVDRNSGAGGSGPTEIEFSGYLVNLP